METHTGGGGNIRYPSTHCKVKSHGISYAHNLFLNHQVILNFCTEHGSDTAMLCAKVQNDLTFEMNAMDERDFAKKIWNYIAIVLELLFGSP